MAFHILYNKVRGRRILTVVWLEAGTSGWHGVSRQRVEFRKLDQVQPGGAPVTPALGWALPDRVAAAGDAPANPARTAGIAVVGSAGVLRLTGA